MMPNKMKRYIWSHLNDLQVGKYAEYFVKMELTMYGFEVYSTEVDDRGIDFVARGDGGPFIEVQVKSLRNFGYVYMQKSSLSCNTTCTLHSGCSMMGRHRNPISFRLASGKSRTACSPAVIMARD
jgi:hypothetical protein